MNIRALTILILLSFQGFIHGMLRMQDPRWRVSKTDASRGKNPRPLTQLDEEEIQELVQYLDGQVAKTKTLEQANQELTKQNAQLDQQLDESGDNLLQLTEQLRIAKAENDELKTKNATLTAQLQKAQSAEKNEATLTTQLREANNRIAVAESSNAKYKKESENAQAANADLVAAKDKLQAKNTALNSKINTISTTLRAVIRPTQVSSAKITASTPANQQVEKDVANLVDLYKQVSSDLTKANSTIEDLQTTNATLTKANQTLQEQQEDQQANLAALDEKTAEIEKLNHKNKTVDAENKRLVALNTGLVTQVSEAEEAANRAKQYQTQVAELQRQLTAVQAQQANSAKDVQTKDAKITELNQKLTLAQANAAKAAADEAALAEISKEKNRLSAELTAANTQLKAAQIQAAGATASATQLALLQKEQLELQKKNGSLQTELDNINAQLKTANASLTTANADKAEKETFKQALIAADKTFEQIITMLNN